jgi:hypothetical protein
MTRKEEIELMIIALRKDIDDKWNKIKHDGAHRFVTLINKDYKEYKESIDKLDNLITEYQSIGYI